MSTQKRKRRTREQMEEARRREARMRRILYEERNHNMEIVGHMIAQRYPGFAHATG